ncbi:uncharacterized protein LOC105630152 isoform X2 [Jatropha curcas]|uniref:uncharacterized protein LOC105630152 isoform X2 n=1 Tax=Jatropha curcas TaxID=180498 RepID=UPI0005FBF83B|nr:uncharacterized protein LOC105630152 isoform X2 [Jatropha curcas]
MSSLLLPSTSRQSNLERFLQCVTPVVPSRLLPQSCIHDLNSLWQPLHRKERVEYFTLGDLWDCYDEWSAYGAGTQVLLNSGNNIMQYYVPYLSAIQIYSNKSALASRNLNQGGYMDAVEFESDSWSDESTSDKLSRSLSNNSSCTWDTISEDSSFDHDGSLMTRDRLGYLYLQYMEICSPCWRVPLMEKITELARIHPGLMTLKNVDLSPASWMAVAWYPIYHIPSQRNNEKDLSTCFLTYHALSSSFQEYSRCSKRNKVRGDREKGRNRRERDKGDERRKGERRMR